MASEGLRMEADKMLTLRKQLPACNLSVDYSTVMYDTISTVST